MTGSRPPWRAFAVLGAAYFLTILDLTIVNVALPAVARDFPGTSLHTLSWTLTLYAIVFGATLVPGAKLGDLYGRRRMFSIGTAAFLTGSIAAALAPTPTCLIVARAVQAMGAAGMTPNSLAVLLPAFAPSKRLAVIGAWGALAGFGAAAGPPLGGILAGIDWRLVFWINLPICVATLLMTRRLVAEVKDDEASRPPDLVGAALLAAAMVAVTLGLSQGAEWQWDERFAECLAGGLAAALLLAHRCRHHPAPIIEPALVRRWSLRATLLGTVTCWSAFCALLVAGAAFLTHVWGYSVFDAGLALTPGPTLSIATAIASRRLAGRVAAARVAAVGALCMTIGAAWMAVGLEQSADYVGTFLPTQLLVGAGMGFLPPMLVAVTVKELPPARLSTGIAVYTIFRQVGAAAGVSGWFAMLGTAALDEASSYRGGWTFIAASALVTAGAMWIAHNMSRRESAPLDVEQASESRSSPQSETQRLRRSRVTTRSLLWRSAGWMLGSAVGAGVVALPDSDQRVLSLSSTHGPSPVDLLGVALLVGCWLPVAFAMPSLWQAAHGAAARLAAAFAVLGAGGLVITLGADMGGVWVIAAGALVIAHVIVIADTWRVARQPVMPGK